MRYLVAYITGIHHGLVYLNLPVQTFFSLGAGAMESIIHPIPTRSAGGKYIVYVGRTFRFTARPAISSALT